MLWRPSVSLVGATFLILNCICMFFMFLNLLLHNKVFLIEWTIMHTLSGGLQVTFIFDWMSCLFFSFVCLISSGIMIYSGEYMSGHPHFNRFIMLTLSFVGAMSMLIFSPNLMSILIGWDGLGLTSYALVIFYQSDSSSGAGMITALLNRLGDAALLVGVGGMYILGSFNFYLYSDLALPFLVVSMAIFAAMTKSAQMPFSAWLPAAMAAPTPVSALVHSSTLVTAGVYLMVRFEHSLQEGGFSPFLLLIGSVTMLMAGVSANLENDLKKVIALSTLSQLGVMISAVGMGAPTLAFFHLLTHALFKALLFMCAGQVIHSMGGSQDIRELGGATKSMPITASLMSVASLALCGAPFLAGFYSKDLIIESLSMMGGSTLMLLVYSIGTGLTVSYTARLSFITFLDASSSRPSLLGGEGSTPMVWSMWGLAMGAVVGGASLSWFILPSFPPIVISNPMKLGVIVVSGLGITLGMSVSGASAKKLMGSLPLRSFLGGMWLLSFITSTPISHLGLISAGGSKAALDKGWYEKSGGQGAHSLLKASVESFESLHLNKFNTMMILLPWFVVMLMLM